MFNFMKKGVSSVSGGSGGGGDDEKERRKREKKLRKEAKNAGVLSGSMSTEELLRLDEVRRSLKIRGRRKEKEKLPSGITADYSAEFFAQLDIDRAALSAELSGEGDSIYELDRGNEEIEASVTTTIESRYNGGGVGAAAAGGTTGAMSIHSMLAAAAASGNGKHRSLPPVPPKPPKRGILKGSRSNISNVHEEITITSPEAQLLVMRNTMQNELPFDGSRSNSISGAATGRSSMGAVGGAGSAGVNPHTSSGTAFTSVESLRSDEGGNAGIQRAMTLPTTARYAPQLPQHHSANLRVMTSPSPSADSLTDTTNSSFATPPFSLSPVGESQGIDRWSRVHAFEDVELPLPPIKLVQLPPARELVIRRQKSPRNDFGFSLRKAICLDRAESLTSPTFKPVIFAEPGAGGGATGLLPGDRLLKVNGTPVSELSREVIIEMIRNSGDSVTVEVQPVSELVELSKRCMPPQGIGVVANADDEVDRAARNANCNTLKRSASKRFKQQPRHGNNTSNDSAHPGLDNGAGNDNADGDAANAANADGERVWLVHRGGFCAALRLPQSSVQRENHKVTIRLLHNGIEMMVDEDDIEKQNSTALDLVEDICDLKQLNEASVLHCLRQRFASNLIHTKAGPTLLVVNPMAPLSLYSEKVVSMFRGCKTEDMPPHIYSLAQTAYRAMLETRRDQSLIFMGRSGSGKTTSFKHALYYLALAAGSYNNFLNAEKVNSINIILEAFGNTKTCLNANATRFTQLLSLDFDQSGQIASASVQVLLPERQRAGRRQPNDHSFHIMGRLLAGAEGLLQKELHLDNISAADNHPFVSLSHKLEERHRAAAEFMRTTQALETLNIEAKAVRGIWSILAAIYHLGLAGVTRLNAGPASRVQFANPSAARRTASLLGVSMEDLTAAAFNATSSGGGGGTSPSKSPNDSSEQAWESLEALAVGLYSEALAAVVALINKAICTSAHTIASIMLVDTPGFQNPASCGLQTGATLSDLRHNYLQERLQLLFHHTTLVAPRDRYAQELVEIDTEGMSETNPGPLVSLIDKAPQNHVVRSSQRDLREHDRRGLLWLLDEESMYPNCNDDTFLERLFTHYGDREHQTLLRKCAGPKQFVLQHLQGTNPVLYTVDGWVRHSREHPAIRNAVTLLQDSSRDEISRLYIGSLTRGAGGIVFCGSIAGLEGTQSLRRVSSIRRSFTSAGVKRNSIMLQVKFTVDGIIDTLRRTGTHFVHCYMLKHNAGQHSSYSSSGSPNAAALQSSCEDMVNIPLLRSQLRGSQVLEAARLHRLGFPESVPLVEFVRRFGLLAAVDSATAKDITVEQILAANEVDTATYRIGPSQILFRSGVLSELEAKRDELLSDRIIQLQAYCRGYLARKQVARRRVQELAVRCIQRNVKAFLAVRDWPWWRLLVRVTPLLNVHRTEEQLKSANEELAMLRAKLEKIENDRNELKTENQKLEAKLSEMAVDLAEERSTANIATERLEAETAERLKLEKELNEQQNKVKNLQENSEKLEMELICAKSDLNGISEDEDPENEEGGSGVYKLKYERVARELEFTKRRLQTQHEHDLEQLVGLKKQLEKKLSDAYEEVEEQRQVVGQWKRKAQKMTNEMNDLRMLLEEQNGRNNVLEKKQRKFDAECQSLQDAARQERVTKDRLSREKDVLIAEKFTLEQNLADTRLELELKEEKLASLQRELEEMTFGGSTEEEIAQLRRSKNELDRRVKEQEEELDEMAGQVQLLEQAKLRLEMSLETMRKEARREAQQRDDELEEARNNSYKKIKALECQLETEHEERTLLLREKHELERRLSSMEDQDRMDRQAEEAATQKLKRDLRKYKALLKDAQAQLERSKAETPGKALIRQLRNQLEDAESARTLVMKARQAAEAELAEVQAMFEESQKGRNDAEDRANAAHRDRAELQAQIEENEEELAELMKKYSAAVKQLNTEQIAASEYEFKLSELEADRNNLKEQVSELQQRLENVESMADPSTAMLSKRLELRTKELESRLDLEQATRTRLEVQVSRLKETLEKVQNDVAQAKAREMQAQDALKKSQKSLRDMREEYHVAASREQESVTKRKDLEKKLEQVESESSALKNDLRLALQRIADLQQAMEEGDDDVSDSEDSHSTDGSLSDLEERLRPIKVKRTTNGELMSPSSTKTLVHEKDDNSPRITLTSPSSPHIHKMARLARAEDAKADVTSNDVDKKATITTAKNSISTERGIEGLKNGDATP
ncbi:PREDICTED: unconventional myosin-XVIIIa isoform X1 [Bactrocera latifrons]|uniref:unconventional myosin-XVIIIa isoform X1 n=1 Tax=Bactrocera latifrons TaxID=174628 RepID=UPI0008DDE482|nr:PREDICTED: unconventional myosin-XVIIIa isoform X1 [Bactrocera latifrons]XP_018790371.1 PREDICTED: unconventional myosin-XVIIIa isoform X1 [Bactrocera latifrons]XP_018790379.1 PREDICTED: unconventional myosin-XVIIIa isoform X1 [Bactrocera latifrons]